MLNPAYTGRRPDVMKLISRPPSRVLDLGCSTGALGNDIQRRFGSSVYLSGIEFDPTAAEAASEVYDHVWQGDAAEVLASQLPPDDKFDLIVAADILEHLIDPWSVAAELRRRLTPDGLLITCLPNGRHFSFVGSLVFRGTWPYRDRGINDRTHLRFFCKRDIESMLSDAGLRTVRRRVKYRVRERGGKINRLAFLLVVPPLRSFIAFQYLHVTQRADPGAGLP